MDPQSVMRMIETRQDVVTDAAVEAALGPDASRQAETALREAADVYFSQVKAEQTRIVQQVREEVGPATGGAADASVAADGAGAIPSIDKIILDLLLEIANVAHEQIVTHPEVAVGVAFFSGLAVGLAVALSEDVPKTREELMQEMRERTRIADSVEEK